MTSPFVLYLTPRSANGRKALAVSLHLGLTPDVRLVDVGDRLTLADFSLAGMTTYVRHTLFPFGSFPNLQAWSDRIEELEAWKRTRLSPWI